MAMTHLKLGQHGEALAVKYLKSQGYRIVATNCTINLGRNLRQQARSGELDIIAYEADMLCFIEVKTRTTTNFALPEEAVDHQKQRQIIRLAQRYRQLMDIMPEPYRFDVVAIVQPLEADPTIKLLRGFFKNRLTHKHAYSWQKATH